MPSNLQDFIYLSLVILFVEILKQIVGEFSQLIDINAI